jgi:alpha-1,6-mannosyltransferase
MKILDVCAFYSPRGGGVKTYVDQKLAVARKLGQEVVIVAPGDEYAVNDRGHGAKVITLKSPRFPLDRKYWYFADAAMLHAVLDAEAPDFVEATSPWRSASHVADWHGPAPRSMVMHADPLSVYPYRILGPYFSRETIDRQFSMFWQHLRRLGNRYDHMVCANYDLAERLAEGGVANTVTVPMGIESEAFSPAHRDPRLRAQLLAECGLSESASLLIGVGRLANEKRWPMVIEAVSAAAQHRPLGLILLGEGRDRNAVMKAMAGNPHIRLFEPLRDRPRFARILASADLLVHGSEAETFCMVAAEARASGLPMVVPNMGGASDHARDGAGISYAWGDPRDMCRAILERLASTEPVPGKARSMEEHFAELFALYERTVKAAQRLRAA